MSQHTTNELLTQEISIPVSVGDHVTIFEHVDTDEDGGFAGKILFEDTIEQYSPTTGLLVFKDSNIGQAKFNELLEQSEGVQIV